MAANVKDALPVSDPREYVYRIRKTAAPFDEVPASIYFYYIGEKVGTNPRPVRHYFYIHGRDRILDTPVNPQLEEIVRSLARNARSNGNNPPQFGADWNYMVWNHKSYLVVLIDDPSVQFETGNGIEFNPSNNGTPNHSFFDARNFGVPLIYQGQTRLAPAVCCINHMKRNEDGDDLGDYPEFFHFVLHTSPQLEELRRLDVEDSGGTNMGPPAPPPGLVVA